MTGPKSGMRIKRMITPRLTMARLSRRRRRSESCKGVGDFFCGGRATSVTVPSGVMISLTSASDSTSIMPGNIALSGAIISEAYGCWESWSFVSIASSASFVRSGRLVSLLHLYAGVDHRIEDVGQQVAQHHRYRQQDRGGLNDGIVAISDGGNGNRGDAGNVENLLNEEGAGDN